MSVQLSLIKGLDTYPTAIAKIASQSSDNNGINTSITYHVSVWKSQAHKDAGEPEVDRDRFEVMLVDLVSADFTGLYNHLMQQERYKDGVEV